MNKLAKIYNKAKTRLDMWYHSTNGLGGSKDPINLFSYSAGTVLGKSDLENLYRFDWVARRTIEVVAEDLTREWIEFKTEDKDIEKDLIQRFETMGVPEKVEEALVIARLFGGCLMIVGAQDGVDPVEPLNFDQIKNVTFLNNIDRYQIQVKRKYGNPLEPNFNEPEIYTLTLNEAKENQMYDIHESRVIRFDGLYLTDTEKQRNNEWHDAVLNNILDYLKYFSIAMHSGSVLTHDFITKVLKMPNLNDLLEKADYNTLESRMQYAISQNSSIGIVLIGDDEEYTKQQTPIAGYKDLLDVYIELMCGAADIPRTRLIGQQLGVLSGAEEQTRTYYDKVKKNQRKYLRRQLEKLIKIFLCCKDSVTKGKEPEDWTFTFKPLWQESDKDVVTKRKTQAEIDKTYYELGILTEEEIAKSRFGQDGYSIETDIDWDSRKDFEAQDKKNKELQLEEQTNKIKELEKTLAMTQKNSNIK